MQTVPDINCSFDFEQMEALATISEQMRHGFETWSTHFPRAEVSIPSMSLYLWICSVDSFPQFIKSQKSDRTYFVAFGLHMPRPPRQYTTACAR